MQTTDTNWAAPVHDNLLAALAEIKDKQTMRTFLDDILTKREISEISMRLEAARLLRDGKKYVHIITATKLSSRTIARISNWLQKGNGGYKTALKAIDLHHAHTSPARAE